MALELGSAWNNGLGAARTSGSGAISRKDGIWVKGEGGDQDPTRRYLGTMRTLAAGQCDDTAYTRYLWNAYNRVLRLSRRTASQTWTVNSGFNWVAFNSGNATWQHWFVTGLPEDAMFASVDVSATTSTANTVISIGIGVDGANSFTRSGDVLIANAGGCDLHVTTSQVLSGWHYLQCSHYSGATVSINSYGSFNILAFN